MNQVPSHPLHLFLHAVTDLPNSLSADRLIGRFPSLAGDQEISERMVITNSRLQHRA